MAVRRAVRVESVQALRVAVDVRRVGETLIIRAQKPLTNFNARNRTPHWSVKNRERKAWQALIATALVTELGLRTALELLGPKSGLPGASAQCARRMRVAIQRQVPSRRNFVRDEFDNLRWATKELRDSLTGLGLIKDDSTKWCEMSIDQAVSEDGLPWTVLTIEPAPDASRVG